MNTEDYRWRLMQLEQKLMERLGEDVDSARSVGDEQAEAGDLAHVQELKEEYFALAQTDSAILAQVRAALTRIDEGTYGRCVVDGEPIDEKRLQSVPWTPYCVRHQKELEERAGIRTSTL
jgi:DnaK suppressor protein